MRAAPSLGVWLALVTASAAARAEVEQAHGVPRRARLAVTTSAGAVYRPLAGLPTYGGELSVGFGAAATRRTVVSAEARYAYARTSHGVPFHAGHLGVTWAFVASRVRLGAGLQLGCDGFERRGRGAVARWTVGPTAFVTVDVATLDRSTVVLGVRGDLDLSNPFQLVADFANDGDPDIHVVPGVSVFAGVRF